MQLLDQNKFKKKKSITPSEYALLQEEKLYRIQTEPSKAVKNDLNLNSIDYSDQTDQTNSKLIEFIDHYEISIGNLNLKKNEILIKFNEITNDIEINGFVCEDYEDKVIINKILLRSFQIPNDVNTNQISSLITQDRRLYLFFPKK